MCLTLGEHGWARQVVTRVERLAGPGGDAAVLRALLLLAANRPGDARRAVEPVVHGAAATSVVTGHVTAWLVEALGASTAGAHAAAHTALLRAVEIAEPERVLRPFYDMGAPVHDLLVGAYARAGALGGFVDGLLDAWAAARDWQARHAGTGDGDRLHRPSAGGMPTQPLTVRELDVLRDLPSMLTVDEIAAQHQVSGNTIKTHLKSVYRKLDVGSRRDAVATARRIGLL
jgi:LuxR family maltose regulon positive regulatory protein